jgi:hypothetical protein
MGIFSKIFGKPIDKVGQEIRSNTDWLDGYMQEVHSEVIQYSDFTFEYLYTTSEQITENGDYGSVIYIRVERSNGEDLSSVSHDDQPIQKSIDKHQEEFGSIEGLPCPNKTRWLYFNMRTIFRAT